MIRAVRKCRRTLSLSLLVLMMSGVRAHATNDACERSHVFYGPSLSFKMVAKSVGLAAARTPWRKKAPRSLGERLKKMSSSDLAALRTGGSITPVAVLPAATVLLAALPRRAAPQTLVPLSSELGTAPPLHTRK